MVIDGRQIAASILERLKKQLKPPKILAAVLVGSNPASISFLKQKEKTAQILGIKFKLYKFKSSISEGKLKAEIKKLNQDKRIGGIIIQLPLPQKINRKAIVQTLEVKKDVDALKSSGMVLPPAVGVLKEILERIHFKLRGKKAVVVGRGPLVGEPITKWLKSRTKSLTVFHTRFFDKKMLKEADLVVSGVGKAGLIQGDFLKKGVVIIDFGYSISRSGLTRISSGKPRIQGDFDFESCREKAKVITPTPGGTGPILVAKLFENFYILG